MAPSTRAHSPLLAVAVLATASALTAAGCGGDGSGGGKVDESLAPEGSHPGECTDGADNDQDGAYDCDDTDCFAAPDCADTDSGDTGPVDRDGDGLPADEDCDDDDPSMPGDDADCDGVSTADDCDDTDPSLPAEDADCDGVSTADDCDDTDPDSTLRSEDADCDGSLTVDDCNDSDPTTYPGAPETDAGLLEDPACDGGGGSLALADYTFVGENGGEYSAIGGRLGYSLTTAGDVDGDGLDDLFVSAYCSTGSSTFRCPTHLFLGRTLAASTTSTIDVRDADLDIVWEFTSGSFAGFSVSSAGDVDGDGLDDIVVGHSHNDEAGYEAGKVYLFLGSTLSATTESSLDIATADLQLIGEHAGDRAGGSVRSAGDVDGDGLDDLLVGAYLNDDGGHAAGKAYLLLGSTLSASTSTAIELSNADVVFTGEHSADFAGIDLSSAGDVDGDGLDDLLVGAPTNDDGGTDAGKAYLILGSSLASRTEAVFDLGDADVAFIGEERQDSAAGSLSSAGDVDGDGLDDLLVGAYQNDDAGSNAGTAYLVLGSSLATHTDAVFHLADADVAFLGEQSDDFAGRRLSAAGDVDGDGLDDLLIGATGNNDGGEASGKVYLVLGSRLAASSDPTLHLGDADFSFIGEHSGDGAGYSLSTAGDVNGDGRDDLFIGAPSNSDGGPHAGKAYVLLSHL